MNPPSVDAEPAALAADPQTLADPSRSPAQESAPDHVEVEEESLSLLERLDRRQNRVLKDLDQLNDDIERLVAVCQRERQQAAA